MSELDDILLKCQFIIDYFNEKFTERFRREYGLRGLIASKWSTGKPIGLFTICLKGTFIFDGLFTDYDGKVDKEIYSDLMVPLRRYFMLQKAQNSWSPFIDEIEFNQEGEVATLTHEFDLQANHDVNFDIDLEWKPIMSAVKDALKKGNKL